MECRHYEIADKFRLATELTRLYVEKLWGKDWVVIESLYEAKNATIIVANSKGGHLEISANADFPAGSVPLVRAQGALTVTSQSGDFTTYLAEQGLTPMFRLYRVKPSWLKRIRDVIAPVSEEADVLEPA